MSYRDFVKLEMQKFDKSIPVSQRMKDIGKLWQSQKVNKPVKEIKASKKNKSKKEKGGDLFGDMFPVLGALGAGLKKSKPVKKEKGGSYGLGGYGEDENIDVLNQLKNVNMDGGSLKKKQKIRKTKAGAFNYNIVPDSTKQMAQAMYPGAEGIGEQLAFEQLAVNGPDLSGGKFKRASIKDFIIKKKKKDTYHVIKLSVQNKQDMIKKSSTSPYTGGDLLVQNTTDSVPTPMGPIVSPNQSANPAPVQSSTQPSPIIYDWATMPRALYENLSVKDIQNITPNNLIQLVGSQLDLSDVPANLQANIESMGGNEEAALLQAAQNLAWWLPPTDPMWQTTLNGVPYFWLCHPNQYSGGLAQIMLYGSYQDFMNTSFYTSYSSRIKTVAAPMNFERYLGGEQIGSRADEGNANSSGYLYNIIKQYGQRWRVMLMKGDLSGIENTGNNWNVIYVDATDLQDYLNMMNAFYNDRDTIQPSETIQMLHTAYLAAQAKLQAQYIAQGISQGQASQKAADDAAEQIKEEQEQLVQQQEQQDEQQFEENQQQEQQSSGDSGGGSDIWGTIGNIAEIGAMFL